VSVEHDEIVIVRDVCEKCGAMLRRHEADRVLHVLDRALEVPGLGQTAREVVLRLEVVGTAALDDLEERHRLGRSIEVVCMYVRSAGAASRARLAWASAALGSPARSRATARS